jgi:hypothetical protein
MCTGVWKLLTIFKAGIFGLSLAIALRDRSKQGTSLELGYK